MGFVPTAPESVPVVTTTEQVATEIYLRDVLIRRGQPNNDDDDNVRIHIEEGYKDEDDNFVKLRERSATFTGEDYMEFQTCLEDCDDFLCAVFEFLVSKNIIPSGSIS